MILQGPFTFDPAAPKASASLALAEAEAVLRGGVAPEAASKADPGLYLVWREEQGWRVAGFWLVLGPGYLSDGPPPAPEGAPPFAGELLDAAVEQVWWNTLQVWPQADDTWRPLVVVEWPPALAARAALAVPGVPAPEPVDPNAGADDEVGGWLDIGTEIVARPRAPGADPEAPTERDLPPLSPERSVVMIVGAALTHTRVRHIGNYFVVDPAALPEPYLGQPSPLAHWWKLATEAPPLRSEAQTPPGLGPALGLVGPRVGFPLSGWLLSTLEPWPEATRDIKPGALRDRDVGSRWRGQVALALGITLGILAAVFVVFVAVERATTWPAEELPAPPATAPQPGLSICSAEPQRFKEELRCQLASLGEDTGSWGMVNCGYAVGAEALGQSAPALDVRAAWCGLRDRVAVDGERVFEEGPGQDITWAEVAAAQACFNALGRPYAYELDDADPAARPGVGRADPRIFLLDTGRRLQGLADVVSELDAACDRYQGQLTAAVEGAIFTEHFGRPREDGRDLAAKLLGVATAGFDEGQRACFEEGVQEGLPGEATYEALCAGKARGPTRVASREREAWEALAPEAPLPASAPSVLDTYMTARFGHWDNLGQRALLPGSATPEAWRCHLTLNDPQAGHFSAPAADPLPTTWGQTLPVPSAYGERRVVGSQLRLDAALRRVSEQPGLAVGDCWSPVFTRIARYAPVHPLLPGRPDAPWPSPEQQLCGQVCAVRHRLASSPHQDRWWTVSADLDACVTREAPTFPVEGDDPEARKAEARRVAGVQAGLDALGVVWNGGVRQGGWRTPDEAEVCAFNLIAQGYLAEQGWMLPDNTAPPLWAGDLDSKHALAGGRAGAAYVAAEGMSTYGRSRSRATCGAVAAQCFASGLLEVMGDPDLQPYSWSESWRAWVAGTRPDGGLMRASPWCELITPFMSPAGELPEGELDYPCAKGVEDMRLSTLALLQRVSGGAAGEAALP